MSGPLILTVDFGAVPFPSEDQPWITADQVAGCTDAAVDLDSVCQVASGLLRNLTGGRYGVRRQTVRPHMEVDDCQGGWPFGVSPTPTGSLLTNSGYGWAWQRGSASRAVILDAPANVLEVVVDGLYLPPSYADGVIVLGQTGIASTHAGFTAADVGQVISGPGIPAGTTITAVASDQATMSAAATATAVTPFSITNRLPGWYLYDRRMLLRSGDLLWPASQDLSQPLTAVGTWGVTIESGRPVPPEGQAAAVALACDLARTVAGSGSSCTPPDRVSSVTRQGVTMARLDPTAYLDEGWTGIKVTDLWLASLRAARKQRRARIMGPDSIRGARS